MPCIKELAQFPIPAIAIFIFVISAYSPMNTQILINRINEMKISYDF